MELFDQWLLLRGP